MSKLTMQSWRYLTAVALLWGCEDRTVLSGETGEEGERPVEPGAMYSECDHPDQCEPLDFCVFQTPDPGFCSARCSMPESDCDPAPGGSATADCVDVGDPPAQLCALDCGGSTCPGGMVCRAVTTNDGTRKICF